MAHATNPEEEGKLIDGRFEFVRYSEKDEVAVQEAGRLAWLGHWLNEHVLTLT